MKQILKKVLISAGFLMLLSIIGLLSANSKVAASTRSVSIFRLYNPNTGEHFYTQSAAEKATDVNAGWSDEGGGWLAPTTGSSVYRVYNPNVQGGDHYYTKSKFEAQSLVKQGWRWDNNGKPVFYSGGALPIYVAYNSNARSGAHSYTGNVYEENSLINAGWKYKAVAWQAISLPSASTDPQVKMLQQVANEMNADASELIATGDYSAFQATVQGNHTLVMTFTFSQNMGSLTAAEAQEAKSEFSSEVSSLLTDLKQAGVSQPSIKLIFKNPNGTTALSLTFP